MVSHAGKELLRNTIRLVGHHNKILEEQEMWKQWELARGLTMMVTDQKSSSTSHRKKCTKEKQKRKHKSGKDTSAVGAGTSKKTSEKWDHSGYMELYPDGAKTNRRKIEGRSFSCKTNLSDSEGSSSCQEKSIKPCGKPHFVHKVCRKRSEKKGLCFSSSKCNMKHVKSTKKRKLKCDT